MELGKRIREYRNIAGWNQDELAEKMFVSRQTISNWENDKSYPDIQSLLLLSNLFEVSLDKLVKGDIEKMTEIINEKDIKEMEHYSKIMTLGLILIVILTAPLCSKWKRSIRRSARDRPFSFRLKTDLLLKRVLIRHSRVRCRLM